MTLLHLLMCLVGALCMLFASCNKHYIAMLRENEDTDCLFVVGLVVFFFGLLG